MRVSKRMLICAAALSLALGGSALFLTGCTEKPYSISYGGSTITSVQPVPEDIVGVWTCESASYAKDCYLFLEEDGSTVMFDSSSDRVAEGTWGSTKTGLVFDLDLFYASGKTDFTGYIFDNGVMTTDGAYYTWTRLDEAAAAAACEMLAEARATNALEAAHPEVDFRQVDRTLEKTAGYSDAYALADQSPFPAIKSPAYWYYDQCTADERSVYDALVALLRLPGMTNVAATATISVNPSDSAGSQAIISLMHTVLKYIQADHPELDFVVGSPSAYSYGISGVSDEGYQITIYRQGSALENRGYGNEDELVAELFASANSLLSGIDLSAPAPVVELTVHDALMDLVSYDNRGATDQASFEDGADADLENAWLQHNVFGALVRGANDTPNCAVCDGYAKSFQLLLQMAGIESVVVDGLAGSPSSAWEHEWTLVCLDGEWYSVDPTWDDECDHLFFNLTTAQMAQHPVTGQIHMRTGTFENDEYTVILPDEDFAPVAYGTTYTYEVILGMM